MYTTKALHIQSNYLQSELKAGEGEVVDLNEVLTEVYDLYPRGISQNDAKYKTFIEFMEEGSLEKIYQDIIEILKNYEVLNWSKVEEYPCYEFVILLHKNQLILDDDIDLMRSLNGVREDLLLYISYISNYYCYYIRETTYSEDIDQWSFKKIGLSEKPEIADLINKLNAYLEQMNYRMLSNDILSHKVPDVDLELIPYGEVTIFHCLFTDLLDFIIDSKELSS
ncbi:hypothetical protein [Paenibacillus monticola]|uniref:Uncharacterized protein n=1 Tax=Paenibacillus monticola TaxID=2666075 RepID=A0A7X2L0N2_9BACL|nr:hypothetical protein [Paenibacillus monticola]MRN52328.1 hypothetical protein [Paenibacillus monticola]